MEEVEEMEAEAESEVDEEETEEEAEELDDAREGRKRHANQRQLCMCLNNNLHSRQNEMTFECAPAHLSIPNTILDKSNHSRALIISFLKYAIALLPLSLT